MKKFEIQSEIDNVELELRSLANEVKTNADANLDEIRSKKASLETRRADLLKELAQCDAPVETPVAETRSCWLDIAKAMKEKRTVTVSGTGMAKTIKELVKKIQDDDSILARARFFYGANASTVIPVWANNIVAQFITEGGSVSPDSANLGNTTIIPKEAFASLPVSDMTLDLSEVELANELPEIFANAFSVLMASEMMTGDGTNMQGIFTDTGVTVDTKAIAVANLGTFALALKGKKYRNPCIVMSSTVYNAFISDTATDETTKIYKEDLIRNKSIEGVAVVITPYAPTTITSGSKIAIGGDLNNYAIGVAGQLSIKQKETAGTSAVTFDGKSYFSGKPIISADFIAYKVA